MGNERDKRGEEEKEIFSLHRTTNRKEGGREKKRNCKREGGGERRGEKTAN